MLSFKTLLEFLWESFAIFLDRFVNLNIFHYRPNFLTKFSKHFPVANSKKLSKLANVDKVDVIAFIFRFENPLTGPPHSHVAHRKSLKLYSQTKGFKCSFYVFEKFKETHETKTWRVLKKNIHPWKDPQVCTRFTKLNWKTVPIICNNHSENQLFSSDHAISFENVSFPQSYNRKSLNLSLLQSLDKILDFRISLFTNGSLKTNDDFVRTNDGKSKSDNSNILNNVNISKTLVVSGIGDGRLALGSQIKASYCPLTNANPKPFNEPIKTKNMIVMKGICWNVLSADKLYPDILSSSQNSLMCTEKHQSTDSNLKKLLSYLKRGKTTCRLLGGGAMNEKKPAASPCSKPPITLHCHKKEYQKAMQEKKRALEEQEEELMEEFEEEMERKCCTNEYCQIGKCAGKKEFHELPCSVRHIQDKAAMIPRESVSITEVFTCPKDVAPPPEEVRTPLPYSGTVYHQTYFRRHRSGKRGKYKRQWVFDLLLPYYPHERYPPFYQPYKTFSMTRLTQCKGYTRQTPEVAPKSPAGIAKKNKRPKVNKELNTPFCPCPNGEVPRLLKPCRCKMPEIPLERCLKPIPKCLCAEREAKLKDKYHLYNNRKILKSCIKESEEPVPPHPCDKKRKPFPYVKHRYDRINAKCPNPYCGLCYEDPNLEFSYEVRKIYPKRRCEKPTLFSCEGETDGEGECEAEGELDGDLDEEVEEEPESGSAFSKIQERDTCCCGAATGKEQVDSVAQRNKKVGKYPYNHIDENYSANITRMLHEAFRDLNCQPDEEQLEEERTFEDFAEAKAKNTDSIPMSNQYDPAEQKPEVDKPRTSRPVVKNKCLTFNKVRQVQEERLKSMQGAPTSIFKRYPCRCCMAPSDNRSAACGSFKQWYCIPPKREADPNLFTLPPKVAPYNTKKRHLRRCDPYAFTLE